MRVPVPWRTGVYPVEELSVILSKCESLCTASRASTIVTVFRRASVEWRYNIPCWVCYDSDRLVDPCLGLLHVIQEGNILSRCCRPISVLGFLMTRIASDQSVSKLKYTTDIVSFYPVTANPCSNCFSMLYVSIVPAKPPFPDDLLAIYS